MPIGKTNRLTLAAVISFSVLAAGGCASQAQRQFPPGSNSSTVAPDRASFPRGQTIPPAGFGVDLVDGQQAEVQKGPTRVALVSGHETAGLHP